MDGSAAATRSSRSSRSAAGFTCCTLPSKSQMTMPDGEACTMCCSR
jgi:hypothetical protein